MNLIKAYMFLLLLVSFQLHAESSCEPYLKSVEGHSIGIRRIESLMGRNVEVIDVSDYTAESSARSEPDLRIFKLDQVFDRGMPFLGFGKPNVFLAIPRLNQDQAYYEKFAAKSLKRAPSELIDTKGKVQSGLLIVFKNIPPEKLERLYNSAKNHVGGEHITCVRANCLVMRDAGFTVGGESMAQYTLPVPLLKDLLLYGLELDGEKVEFDIVRTSPNYLEDLGAQITGAVWSTPMRHLRKALIVSSAEAEKNTFLVKIKKGAGHLFGVYMNSTDGKERPKLEEQIVRLNLTLPMAQMDMTVTEPTDLGTVLRIFWGPHAIFNVNVDKEDIQRELPDVLQSFPDPKPSLATKLKKYFIFSKPVVSLLRSQLAARESTFASMDEKQLYDMLRADSADFPNRYNIVVTGDKVHIMKISVGAKLADWVLSKHVLISNYSKDVRYAGEIWKDMNGVIHINNNSGTYKPSREQVGKIVGIFQKMFPNVKIEGNPL